MREPFDVFGHNVEVFARLQWHVNARHTANLVTPHTATVHDHVCLNVASVAVIICPVDTSYNPAFFDNISDFNTFLDQRPTLARTFGQCQCDVAWIALSVQRQIDRAFDTSKINVRVQFLDPLVRYLFNLNTESTSHTCLAVNLFAALFGQCNRDGSYALKAGGHACFGFQCAVKFLGILRQLGHIGRRT